MNPEFTRLEILKLVLNVYGTDHPVDEILNLAELFWDFVTDTDEV